MGKVSWFVLCLAAAAGIQTCTAQDAEGCKDSPLIGRFPESVITKCKDMADDSFKFTFTKAGKFAYYCAFHGTAGGGGMSGTITVTN